MQHVLKFIQSTPVFRKRSIQFPCPSIARFVRTAFFGLFAAMAALCFVAVPAHAVIDDVSDPEGTYNLRDTITVTANLVGPQAGGEGRLILRGSDIYGNSIDWPVALAGVPALAGAAEDQQPETATVFFTWQIPNDGTLHNVSEGGYSLVVEVPNIDDLDDPLTSGRGGVRIDVTPNLELSNIEVAPGTYRAGDIIQIAASITNLERSGVQSRPLRPSIADTYRTEILLTDSPELDRTNDFLLGFFTTAGSFLGLGPMFSDLPDGRDPIRKVEVRGTPPVIDTLGRDYSPQPDDGYLDHGEILKVSLEVMIPWNFAGEYFVGAVVDSLEEITETFEPDNTLVNLVTPQIRIVSSDEPKVDPISERTGAEGELIDQSNGTSDNAAVSDDGEWVVFDSFATNLDPEKPGNGNRQVYLRNTLTRELQMISLSSVGQQGNRDSTNPVISSDGRFIAFESRATNLVSGSQGAASHIYVYDRFLERTRRVSVNADGVPANGSAFEPSISADGRFVVFRSTATNLDPAFSALPSSEQVFLHDRNAGGSVEFDETIATRMVSVGVDAAPADRRAFDARISMDGDVVVFVSRASNLSLSYSDTYNQVWYREVDPNGIPVGQIHLVSVDDNGDSGKGNSSDPVVNGGLGGAYGLQIAFVSLADNLVPNDTNGAEDIFVRDFSDPDKPVTTRVSVSNPRVAFGRIYFEDPFSGQGVAPNRPDSQPEPGDTIKLDDGINPAVTFTFVNLKTAPEEVEIAANAGLTRDNLAQGINERAAFGDFNFFAYASNPPTTGFNVIDTDGFFPGVSIFNTVPGAHGNTAILVNSPNDKISADGMYQGGEEATPWNLPGAELGSLQPSIDRSGRLVAFRTLARNLSVIRDGDRFQRAVGEAATPGVGEIIRPLYRSATSNVYLRDRDLRGDGLLDLPDNTDTQRVSVNPFGYPTNRLLGIPSSGSSRGPALSANGRFVAFATDSANTDGLRFGRTNTQPLDTNGRRDIFVFDRASVVPIVPVVENPPFIAITSPIAGASISSASPFFISASAIGFDETSSTFNQGSIVRVTFFINGQEEVSLTQPPFATLATPRGEGPIRIFAIAEDSRGNTSRSATVEISAATLPFSAPTLNLLNPNATINTQFSLGENVDLVSRLVRTAGSTDFLERYAFSRAVYYVNGVEVFSTTEESELISASYTFERLGAQTITAGVLYERIRRSVLDPTVFDPVDAFPRFENIFSDQVQVNVIAEASPSVVFTSPRTGNAVGINDSLALSARPTAAAGGDLTVEYFLISETDASVVSLGVVDASSNYKLDWTINKLGGLSFFAVVEETVAPGDVRRSTSQRVDVVSAVRDNLPSVAIESLATTDPLTQVESGSVVQLRANARGENANANDVETVEFFVNGQSVGDGSRVGSSSTYELEWLPTMASDLSDLRATITAEVTSEANGVSVVSAPIFVEIVRGAKPTVTVTSPSEAQQLFIGQEVPVTASASVAGGTIANVAFFWRTTPGDPTSGDRFGEESASPYQATFTSPSTGEFFLYAVATSQSGRATASAPVQVTVVETGLPVLSAPRVPVASITLGSELPVAVDAGSQFSSVARVELFANNIKVGEVTGSTSSTYVFNWRPTAEASYDLKARVTDALGNVAESPVEVVNVSPAIGLAPSVIVITFPAGSGGNYSLGSEIPFTAFARDVDGTIDSVTFLVDGIPQASDGTTFVFTPPTAGRYAVSALVVDNDGNTAISSTVLDVRQTSSVPALLEIDSPSSVTVEQFRLGDSIIVDGTINAQGTDLEGIILLADGIFAGAAEPSEDGRFTFVMSAEKVGSSKLRVFAFYSTTVNIIRPGALIEVTFFTTSVSDAVEIAVTDAPAPLVQIVSPRSLDRIRVNTERTIEAQVFASETGSDLSVEFFADGVSVGETNTAPYRVAWTPSTIGPISLTAIATENPAGGGEPLVSRSAAVVVNSAIGAGLSVELTSPTDSSELVLGSSVSLAATPSGTEGDLSVRFFANGRLVGTAESLPFTATWQPQSAGTYRIVAQVIETVGGNPRSSTSLSNQVTVIEGNAPTVEITAPSAAQELFAGQGLPITASASVAGGTIAEVAFYWRNTPGDATSGNRFGSDGAAPYSATFSSPSVGEFFLYAVATSQSGRSTASDPVFVIVAPIAPPTLGTVRADRSSATVGQPIELSVTASSSDSRIARVEFLANGRRIGFSEAPVSSGGNNSQDRFVFIWRPTAAGSFSLTAEASDEAGNSTVASGPSVSVTPFDPVNNDENFVEDIFGKLFGREPTSNEQANALEALDGSFDSRVDYILELLASPAFESTEIAMLIYRTMLGDWPDAAELEQALSDLLGGSTRTETLEGEIPVGGSQTFALPLVANSRVVASVTPVAGNANPLNDPTLAVRAPNGSVIAFNDDFFGLNPQISFTPAVSGNYSFIVAGFTANSGAFTLSVEIENKGGTGITDPNALTQSLIASAEIRFGALGTSRTFKQTFRNKHIGVSPIASTEVNLFNLLTGPSQTFGGRTVPGYNGDNVSYFTQFALDNDRSGLVGPGGLPLSALHLYAMPNDPRRELQIALLIARLLDQNPTDSRVAAFSGMSQREAVSAVLRESQSESGDNTALPAALAGSSSLGSGWHSSGWLGSFGFDPASGEPWVFSRDFGWVYIQPSGTPSGAWIYSSKLNTWLWGGSDLGRFFYRADVGSWIWVSSNPNGSGAWLYNTNAGNWSFVTP